MSHNIGSIIKNIRNLMRGDKGINGDAQRIEQLGWMIFLKIFDDKDIEMELLDDDYISPIPSDLQWRNWAADDEGITGDEMLDFIDNKLFSTLKTLAPGTMNKRAILVREVFEGNNNYMKSGTIIRQVINKLNEINFNSSEDRHLFGDIYETILKELQSAGDSGEFYTPRAITNFITDMVNPKLGETILDPACGTGGYLTSAIEHIRKNEVKSVDDRLTLQHSIKGIELKPLPHMLALTNLILHDIEVPNIEYDDALSKELSSITQKDRVDVILANPPFGGNVTDGMEMNFPMNYRTKESADLFLILMIQYLKDGGRAGIVLPDGSLTGEGVKARIRQKLLEECNLHTIIRLPNSVFQPYASVATNLLFFQKGTPTKEVWYYEHQLPEGQKSYSKTKPIKLEEFDPIKLWWDNRVENEQSWKVDIDTIKANGFNLEIKNPNRKEEHTYSSTEILEMLHQSFHKSDDLLNKLKNELVNETNLHEVRIGDFLKRIKRPIELSASEEYKLVTVKLHHKGVVLREHKSGKNIKSKMYQVRKGDFILSGIDARNGAFGIVPEELDGAVVTNDFWYFELDHTIVDKHFFLELTSTAWFDDICKKGSDGTTQRIRLQKDKFFNQVIQIPLIDEQKKFIQGFETIKNINDEISIQMKSVGKLRQAILQKAIQEKTTLH